jgi:DNA-directed RNA polymerase subunit RPC12/RpoP
MINLRACARCGGDLIPEEFPGDIDLVCLQCGHRTAVPSAQPAYKIRVRPAQERRRPLRRAA